MVVLFRGLCVAACMAVAVTISSAAYAGVLDEEYTNSASKAVAPANSQKDQNQAGQEAVACQKKITEVNEARAKKKYDLADQLEKESKKLCTQNYSGTQDKLEAETTAEESNQTAAAAEDAATASTASNSNFGGAGSEAQVTTEMPAELDTTQQTAAKADTAAATDTAATTTAAAQAEEASDATISVDSASQTPAAQTTEVTATELMASGKIPASAADRAALVLQYAREKGMTDEETQALMQLIYRENASLNPTAKNPTSSAYGIGQYIDSTWNSRCTQFGDRSSFKAQVDCLINDTHNRYVAYTSGKQTCGGTSFDTCNYIQHYAGSYSAAAAAKGYIADALNVIQGSAGAAAKFYATAASALGSGSVASILASMKTIQDTGLGASVAQMFGSSSGVSTQSLVSQFLGLNSSVSGSSSTNILGNALASYLNNLMSGSSSSDSSSSSSGTTSSSTSRTLSYTETTVNSDGSIKTVQYYSDGLMLTSQTAPTGATTVSTLSSVCGGSSVTSSDALMLMLARCVAGYAG